MSRKLYSHLVEVNYENVKTKIIKQTKPFKNNTKKHDAS